jgi:hypothetical protein
MTTTTTTQNLYNELIKLTDNAEQIKALLKVLPGQSYSEDDLRKIINDQKDEAFQQFKSLETKLELNQKDIELTIARWRLKLHLLDDELCELLIAMEESIKARKEDSIQHQVAA